MSDFLKYSKYKDFNITISDSSNTPTRFLPDEFTFTRIAANGKVEVSTINMRLSEVVEGFEVFLKACGFQFDRLDVVMKEEVS